MSERREGTAATTSDQPAMSGVETLYRREYDAMVRLAYLLTGSVSAAEEVVQDVFVDVHRRSSHVEVTGGYVRVAVLNACRDHHRRSGRIRRRLSLLMDRERTRPTSDEPANGWADLGQALSSLSAPQREAIVLRYYLDLPVQGVAEAMTVPSGTAKSHIHRGLAVLRAELEGVNDG